ncbi:E3 ubiquitin-protein ligase FANCL [Biomphalaria glabrata]|nr:E3 ubiquitin-protein ligase FANCL-like [Biomphalaria glabrata]KAI8784562.1 E3 ubiquitin-protein ligase FANCL [Biomphalaria glabrata]
MSVIDIAPLLLPLETTDTFNKYFGFLNILGHYYKFNIQVPKEESKLQGGMKLECEWALHHRLGNHVKILIKQRLNNANSLASFLKDFVFIVENSLKDSFVEPELCSVVSLQILEQIQELGWNRLLDLDQTLSLIELAHKDDSGRMHKLKIFLNKQDVTIRPICQTQLPEAFNFIWSGKTRLSHIFQEFEVAVNLYQNFWNMLKEIDDNCCVLEPEKPTFASTNRRIAIKSNLSLHIVVNCRQPTTFPECKFVGNPPETSEFRETLNLNLHRWDVERSLYKNLQEVLDIDFPSPTDVSIQVVKAECGICYCHNQNEEVPDIVCEDQRCSHAFHQSCLYEWLRNLNARQNANTLFGECPFCDHPIRVKVPALLT